jgi:hypothetical protein
LEIVDSSLPIEVQIELPQNSLRDEDKGQNGVTVDNISLRREDSEPLVVVTSSSISVPEILPGMVQASVVTSSQVRYCTSKQLERHNFSYSLCLRLLFKTHSLICVTT